MGASTEGPARPLPVLQGLRPFERHAVPADVVAGVTLAALAIPEVMGYATIAGMPVVTGLYTLLLPLLAFALLGSSRHLVVGADSATAAVTAGALASLAVVGSARYVALAGLLALLAAGFLLLARLVRLGFLADFLSRTVLIGFLTGVGVQVASGQVGAMLGIPEGSGVTIGSFHWTSAAAKLLSTLPHLGQASVATVAVSASVLAVIVGLRMVTRTLPGALVAVVGAMVVSWHWDLAAHGVATLGPLAGGLPSIGLPDVTWSDVAPLLGTAVTLFVLILTQSAATSRAYAAKEDDQFDENIDLVGLTAANLAAGLSGTFVVNGSPTKTQMVDGAGGRSQVSQLTTGVIVLVVLLFLTGPVQYLPDAVLASVVFLIGLQLVDLPGLRRVRKVRLNEYVVALLVALTVFFVGVEQGILLAMAASLVDHLRRSYRPPTAVLVPMGTVPHWHGVPPTTDARTVPGLVVYRFAGSLYYANAGFLFTQLTAFLTAPDPPTCICLDAAAMPDIDYSGGEVLRQLHDELAEHHVRLVVAEPMSTVRRELDRYGLTALLGSDAVYDSVVDAVHDFVDRQTGAPGAPGAGEH